MDIQKKEKGTTSDRLVLASIACALLALMLVFLTKCHKDQETTTPQELQGIVWDENAEEGGRTHRSEEEIREELNRKVEEGMINISMNTSPVFENGSAPGNLMIVNSEHNNYPQIVYIVLKDNGEEIYRSGAIRVGSKIEQAKLDTPLPAGRYDCVAYFNNVNPDTGDFLGTAGAEITITVQH